MSRLQTSIAYARRIIDTSERAELTLLAAGISFYALLSIVPLAVVIVALAATIGADALVDLLGDAFGHLITEDAISFVETGLEADAGRSAATITGLVFVTWGSLKVFRGLDRAFNTIYGSPGTASLVVTIRNGLAVLIAITGVLTTLGVALLGLFALGFDVSGSVLPLLATPAIAVTLLPMYAVFPPTRYRLRDVLPGAIVAAIGITVSTALLQLYITLAAPFAVYGVLAGVFISMTWLYIISIVILLGAVVNVTLVGNDRQVHARGAFHATSGEVMSNEEPEVSNEEDDGEPDEVSALRAEFEELEASIEERTVPREEVEHDLKRYVRRRQRRGHARGWGPYLVLLYGVILTLGAFYLLPGGWAILAMIIIWLSTLGLYVFMIVTGATIGVLGIPGRLRDRFSRR